MRTVPAGTSTSLSKIVRAASRISGLECDKALPKGEVKAPIGTLNWFVLFHFRSVARSSIAVFVTEWSKCHDQYWFMMSCKSADVLVRRGGRRG